MVGGVPRGSDCCQRHICQAGSNLIGAATAGGCVRKAGGQSRVHRSLQALLKALVPQMLRPQAPPPPTRSDYSWAALVQISPVGCSQRNDNIRVHASRS